MKLQEIPAGVLVFTGGGLGACVRALVGTLLPDGSFPQTTLFINLVGAFILGFLTAFLTGCPYESSQDRALRLGVGTGVMGGFTTYSTFTLQTYKLLQTGQIGLAFSYLLSSLIAGILCCWLGFILSEKYILRKGK